MPYPAAFMDSEILGNMRTSKKEDQLKILEILTQLFSSESAFDAVIHEFATGGIEAVAAGHHQMAIRPHSPLTSSPPPCNAHHPTCTLSSIPCASLPSRQLCLSSIDGLWCGEAFSGDNACGVDAAMHLKSDVAFCQPAPAFRGSAPTSYRAQ